MSRYVRYVRFVAVSVGSILVLAGCGGGSSPAAAKTPVSVPVSKADKAQILAAVRATAVRAGSMHVVFSLHSHGAVAQLVADVGLSEGSQVLTDGPAVLTTEVYGGRAYINANKAAETNYLHESAAVAAKDVNRWVDLGVAKAGSGERLPVMVDVLDQALPTSIARIGDAKVGSQGVLQIEGPIVGGTALLDTYMNRQEPLPIQSQAVGSSGTSDVAFSGWGEAINVKAPSNIIPTPIG